jgi:hypothetical protein
LFGDRDLYLSALDDDQTPSSPTPSGTTAVSTHDLAPSPTPSDATVTETPGLGLAKQFLNTLTKLATKDAAPDVPPIPVLSLTHIDPPPMPDKTAWRVLRDTGARFSGRENVESFISRLTDDVEQAVKRDALESKDAALGSLNQLFTDSGYHWWRTYGRKCTQWDDFIKKLRGSFRRNALETNSARHVSTLTRRRGESNREFGLRIASANEDLAATKQLTDHELKETFLVGQGSRRFRNHIQNVRNEKGLDWTDAGFKFDDFVTRIAVAFDGSPEDKYGNLSSSDSDDDDDDPPPRPSKAAKKKHSPAAASAASDDDMEDLVTRLGKNLKISTHRVHEMIAAARYTGGPTLYNIEAVAAPTAVAPQQQLVHPGQGHAHAAPFYQASPAVFQNDPGAESADEVYFISPGGQLQPVMRPRRRQPCRNCSSTAHPMSVCPTVTCYSCQTLGHTSRVCTLVPRAPATPPPCRICNSPTHMAPTCPQQGQQGQGAASQQPQAPAGAPAGQSFQQRG